MPLLDHFHPPLSQQRHWESFHQMWAVALADALNGGLLPPDHFAEMQVSLGGKRIEMAVPTPEVMGKGAAGVFCYLELPATFPDEVEVLVFSTEGGPTLVGAIELVSPRNKDRPDARRALAIKCLSYLQAGIGLVLVDVVTTRRANLHDEMVQLLPEEAPLFPNSASLYAAAYRPFRRPDAERIAVWPVPLTLGQEIPALPLWLRGVPAPVRVDLEAAYTEARQRSLLP